MSRVIAAVVLWIVATFGSAALPPTRAEAAGTLGCHVERLMDTDGSGEYWTVHAWCTNIAPCYEVRARVRAYSIRYDRLRVLSGYFVRINGQHSEVTRRWDYWIPTVEFWFHVRRGSWC